MSSPFDQLTFMHGPAMSNRLMLAPLTNQQSHADGTISDEELHWLRVRAQGGFGLTMTCAAHVQAVGQGFAGQLGIWSDDHLEGLGRLADALNAAGTVSYAQLHHAGNRAPAALIGTQPVCPSDDPPTGARALTTAEVHEVASDFVAAARRAQLAGFHGVELHGAHGYLLCQFLSAELNQRTDEYGGSLENRSRLLFEIVAGIRAECGDGLALAVRLSPERFGMRVAEIAEVYGRLVATGQVDMIDMSLWDIDRCSDEAGFEGRPLMEIFAGLPRGDVRLGVAGKDPRPGRCAAGVGTRCRHRRARPGRDPPSRLPAPAGRRPGLRASPPARRGGGAEQRGRVPEVRAVPRRQFQGLRRRMMQRVAPRARPGFHSEDMY
jgi:2,4-dienoyl-CoA reductase-like NADH-dependent reductase (Old Yellow Enzyme family)